MKKRIIPLIGIFILFTGLVVFLASRKQTQSPNQKPLTEEELDRLDAQDLSTVLPPKLAETIAKLSKLGNTNITFTKKMIPVNAQTAVKFKYGENPSEADLAKMEEDTTKVENILFNNAKRRADNKKLQEQFFQAENERWRKKLPLHRDNLTFRSATGKRPVSHKKIDCPSTTMWGGKTTGMMCYEYKYPKELKSIFYFSDDVLHERDDLDQNILQARYIFHTPPFYTETRPNLVEPVLAGRVWGAHLYNGNLLPYKDLTFDGDGIVISKLTRDFATKTIKDIGYDSEHHFHSFSVRHLTQLTENPANVSADYELYVQIIWPTVSTENTPRRYGLAETKNGHTNRYYGSWKENENHATVLDNGMIFPAATEETRAPTYCDLYPKGCKKK